MCACADTNHALESEVTNVRLFLHFNFENRIFAGMIGHMYPVEEEEDPADSPQVIMHYKYKTLRRIYSP